VSVQKQKLMLLGVLVLSLLFTILFFLSIIPILKYKVYKTPGEVISSIHVGWLYDGPKNLINTFMRHVDKKDLRDIEQTKTKMIRIEIEPSSLEAMTSNLPQSAKNKYYSAKLLYPDGEWRKIKYRLRGRNIWHWDLQKPSLRLKLKKDFPIALQNTIELINPEDRTFLGEIYSNLYLKELGVLSHRTEMVGLFINGVYYGAYLMMTRDDENMLRANHRLPGPIYVGDYLAPVWEFKDFELKGEQKSLADLTHDPLDRLLNNIRGPITPETFESIWTTLNKRKMAEYMAALSVLGGIHSDYHHNQAFYLDPKIGLLEPIGSDIMGLGALLYPRGKDRLLSSDTPSHDVPLNERLTPLTDTLLRDPFFYHLRNQALFDQLTVSHSAEKQILAINTLDQNARPLIQADGRKSYLETISGQWFRMPLTNAKYLQSLKTTEEWIRKRSDFLLSELERCDVEIQYTPVSSTKARISLNVDGNSALSLDLKKLTGSISALVYDDNGKNEQPIDTETIILFPGLSQDESFVNKATSSRRFPSHYLRPKAQTYQFILSSPNLQTDLVNLSSGAKNAITGRPVKPKRFESHPTDATSQVMRQANYSVHPWLFKSKPRNPIQLGPGVVTVNQTIIGQPNQKIMIHPGTKLLMDSDVSIISQGPLLANGSPNAPIVVQQKNRGEAWGSIVIIGDSSDNSLINHATISGGSRTQFNSGVHSGMLSVVDSSKFTLTNSNIGENVIGDDTINLIYSNDVVLENNKFFDCFADCIDFDFSSGVITRNRFINAGNDGMDFMESEAIISQSHIEKAGDKGISAGEMSKISVSETKIENAPIGIAAKDGSIVEVSESTLAFNEVAVDIFEKNWRYGETGFVTILKTNWINNVINIRSSKTDRAYFDDASINVELVD